MILLLQSNANNTVIAKPLLIWFKKYGRHNLPWQGDNVYHIWVSEIMLQQTQVSTVMGYFHNFIAQFPNIINLANAPQDKVMQHWAGLGYYARARNLHKTAQIIRDDYQGNFPQDLDQVLALHGIGQSTAAAILSLAFNQHHAILDGNVKRVLSRFCQIQTPINQANSLKQLWQLATHYTPKKQTAQYTQAIMDLGANICTRTQPKCALCPLTNHCLAYKNQVQHLLPAKASKKTKPIKDTLMLVITNQDKILLQKRPETGIWGGLWSLPECTEKTVKITLQKLGIVTYALQKQNQFRHTFTHYHLNITPVLIQINPNKSATQPIDHPVPLTQSGYYWYETSHLNCGIPAPVKTIFNHYINYKNGITYCK